MARHDILQFSDLLLPDLYEVVKSLKFTEVRVLDIGFNGLVQGPWTSRTGLECITQLSIFRSY